MKRDLNEYLYFFEESLHLYLDIHAGWQIQVREIFDRFRCRIDDVDQALVHTHLILITGILMHERGTIDSHFVDFCRERDGSGYDGTGTFGCLDNLPRGLVNHFVIVRLDLDPDAQVLRCFCLFHRVYYTTTCFPFSREQSRERRNRRSPLNSLEQFTSESW